MMMRMMLKSVLLIAALIVFDPVTAQPLQPPQLQLRRGASASASSGSDTTRSLQQEEENDRRSLASIGGGNDVNGVNADGSSNSNNNPNLSSGNSDCTRSNPDCTQSPIPIPVPETTVTTATEEEEEVVEVEEETEDCLIETICSIPELEILCGYMLRSSSSLFDDDSSASSSSNSSNFTTTTATFFAPNNDAFDSLPALVVKDVTTNPDVFKNILMYHSVIGEETSSINVNDLICNEELIMAYNNETTKTLCFGGSNNEDNKKVQIGNGNLPMRSLPFIIQSNINACNGQTLIHIVDQVILPSLPLVTVTVAEETASVVNSSIIENEDEGEDIEDEGEGVDICGGILETICSTNELETLCTLLDMLEEESSLDFLLDVGTFFAPTNRAFDSLAQSPPVFADLLEDVDILLNVMKYHAVNPTNANDANTTNYNSTGTLLFYDELECDDQILMVNQETTRTLCMNTNNGDENGETEEQTKVQLGIGNMPMRTLPKIIFDNDNDSSSANSSEIEIITCDGNAIIHLVDQVILPSLPLSSGNENGGSLIIVTPEEVEESMVEEGIVGDGDDDGFPADGSSNVTNSSDDDEDEDTVVTVTTTRAPATTPVAAVCPLNPQFNSPCRTVGDICDYDHLYTGCTWEDLQCTPVISCECFSDETWQCLIAASVQCNDGIGGGGFGGSSMMFEFENEPVAAAAAAVAATNTSTTTIPDGLPWGDRCDPSDDLPQAQPDTIDGGEGGEEEKEDIIVPVEVEGRLNGECPESGPNFGPCSDEYVPNLICEYDYIYTGCSWDELSCGSVMSCECDQFNDGDWACRSFSMFPCNAQTTPNSLPWGQSCDPSSPLPEEPDQQQQEQQRRPSSSMRDIP